MRKISILLIFIFASICRAQVPNDLPVLRMKGREVLNASYVFEGVERRRSTPYSPLKREAYAWLRRENAQPYIYVPPLINGKYYEAIQTRYFYGPVKLMEYYNDVDVPYGLPPRIEIWIREIPESTTSDEDPNEPNNVVRNNVVRK